mgnify:CR=1 FL=1
MKYGLSESFYQKIKEAYKKALGRLEEALQEKETDLVIDGVLHRFEFTFELSWKTMKDCLEYLGIVSKTGSPREIIQAAFKQGLIENGERWIDIMLARNSLSNLYDEETSREIYYKIKEIYVKEFKRLEEKLNGI